jgi:hypothetical protein
MLGDDHLKVALTILKMKIQINLIKIILKIKKIIDIFLNLV